MSIQWLDPGTAALAIFGGPQAYVTPCGIPASARLAASSRPGIHRRARRRAPVAASGGIILARPSGRPHRGTRTGPRVAVEGGRRAPDYLRAAMKGIVAFGILLTSLQGKWKRLSQNRDNADREGVARGLDNEGRTEMADAVHLAHYQRDMNTVDP